MLVDLVVLGYIGISAFNGYRKGLSNIIVNLLGFLLAIVLAFCFQGMIADSIINNTTIDNTLADVIKEGVTKAIDNQTENTAYYSIISKFGNTQDVGLISNNITALVIKAISFVIIFLIVNAIVFMLQMLLNIVFKLPILSSIDKIGGLVGEGIMSIFKVLVVLAIISVLVTFNVYAFENVIKNTNFVYFLYNNNIIMSILSSNLKV